MSLPTILQGTDGIRGRVSLDDPHAHGMNALQFFLEKGFLTPSFFEHYTYAYGSLLLESGFAEKGASIVIGWDPRDQTGEFNRAAISGLRKASFTAVVAGVLPTPAVPIYMLQSEAAGSVVLTASHNPSDQNGIKLFHGWTALKFLPSDDIRLSRKIFQQQDMELGGISELGDLVDQSESAKSFFIKYQTDSRNSWIDGLGFEDQVVVIDASKGAVATVIRDIFDQYPFNRVIYTNMEGGINEWCGVADLEGLEEIKPDEILNETKRFFRYQTLRTMMETVADREDIRSGEVKLSGLVFDGDGDRCFMLDYDPYKDRILISSGDQLGIHLIRYVKHLDRSIFNGSGIFINTVESDLKTAITAEEEGFQTLITGVGDKWILKQAVLDKIRAELIDGSTGAEQIIQFLEKETFGSDLSGLDLSKAWKTYCKSMSQKASSGDYRFLVGIEESGHSITPGFINSQGGWNRCFAGNGIKSGLNVLVALQQISRNKSNEERIAMIRQPFNAGVKSTSYVYYVDKEKLQPGSPFRLELETAAAQMIDSVFPESFSFDQVRFPEEEGLVYFRISQADKTKGAVFVRNSGTENKSALYLRGERDIEEYLEQVGLRLHMFLLKGMKKLDDEFIALEESMLRTVDRGESLDVLRQSCLSLPFERILKEVEFKEGLISRDEAGFKLTEKGKLLNDYWKAQDKFESEEKK